MFIEVDLSLHYTLNGDPVRIHGEADDRYGIFAETGQSEFGGDLITTAPSLRYPVDGFPSLVRGTQLVVSNRTWKVRQAPRLLTEGKEAIALLEEVSV